VIYLALILGIFMLTLSARQTVSDVRLVRLNDIPMRIRQNLRRHVQGYWVRSVRVTMHEGQPAYWFTGSTPKDSDLALLVLGSGETAILAAGTAKILEKDGAAPVEASRAWISLPRREAELAPGESRISCRA
jgi:hypothetical protein